MKFTHRYKLVYEADFPSGSEKDERFHHQIKQFISSFTGITSVRLEKSSSPVSSKEDEIYSILFASESFIVKNTFIYKNEVYLKDEILKVESVDFGSNLIKTSNGKKIDLILFFENVEPFGKEKKYNNSLNNKDMAKLSEAYTRYQEGLLDRMKARAMGTANLLSGAGRDLRSRFSSSKKDPYISDDDDSRRPVDYKSGYKGGVILELVRSHSEKIGSILRDYANELQRRHGLVQRELDRMMEWRLLEKAVFRLQNTLSIFADRVLSEEGGTPYEKSRTMTPGEEDRMRRTRQFRSSIDDLEKMRSVPKPKVKSKSKEPKLRLKVPNRQ